MYIDFSKASIEGRTINSVDGEISFKCHSLGELVVTSGHIIACDPLVCPDRPAFSTVIPNGRYPVTVSVAGFGSNGDQRVAYAKLQVSDKPVARWEMALLPGQDLASLKEGKIFCHPVDSGTSCFMDYDASQILLEKSKDENFGERLIEEMEKNYIHTCDWLNFCLDSTSGLNVITFSSGFGDACYASYFGFDENDNVVSLVTDFSTIEDEEVIRD